LQSDYSTSEDLKSSVKMKYFNGTKGNKLFYLIFSLRKPLLLTVTVALLAAMSSCGSDGFTVSGTVKDAGEGEYIVLRQVRPGMLEPVDSVVPDQEGKFSLRHKTPWPAFFMLSMGSDDFLTLLAAPGERISVEAKRSELASPMQIRGSEESSLMLAFRSDHQEVIKELQQLTEVYNDSLGSPRLPLLMDSLDRRAAELVSGLREKGTALLEENSSSMVAIWLLNQQVVPGKQLFEASREPELFYRVDSLLFDRYPEADLVIDLHRFVAGLRNSLAVSNDADPRPAVGSLLPEIALPGPDGDTVRLSSTRGRIVLVDFWAAWCPPCREENPNLVALYDLYHSRGFDIYQVSLDIRKEDWTEAIRKDRLGRWHHVSDLKYRDSEVVRSFGLSEIPSSFLLDREGRVLAVNLRGDALRKKVEELLGGQ
jgi:peroxiredoxin